MAKHRYTTKIPRLKKNLYTDGSLTFRAFMWELYRETISLTEDERPYSNALLRYLTKHAVLVESYSKIEREIIADDDDPMPFYSGGFTLYLYKDNLVAIKEESEGTIAVDCYYPTSKPCIIKEFAKYVIKEKGESKVSILISRNGSLVAQKVSFAPPVIGDLELNYGSGFGKVHELMLKKLNERKSGIIICHGSSGSGKSTYLKYLTSIVNREFLYVPVGMAQSLAEPSFISLLLNKKECVLILEDAEQAVQQRGTGSNDTAVSTLLNLGDGVLGSLLSATIIVTYNAPRQEVDKALLRPGRLMIEHDFGPLSEKDAERLVNYLKLDVEVAGPMTLADIYNSQDRLPPKPSEPVRELGFHTLISTPTPILETEKKKEKEEP